MKKLDGNYKHTMVTNQVMNKLEEELRENVICRIENCNFVLSDGNLRLFEKWIDGVNLDGLINLKVYGDHFGYDKLAPIINAAINEYAEEY